MSTAHERRVPPGRLDIAAYAIVERLVEQSGDPALLGWHARFAPAIESLAREYLGPVGLRPEDDEEWAEFDGESDDDDEEWEDEDECDEDKDEDEDEDEEGWEDEADGEDSSDDLASASSNQSTCSSRPRGPVVDAEFVEC